MHFILWVNVVRLQFVHTWKSCSLHGQVIICTDYLSVIRYCILRLKFLKGSQMLEQKWAIFGIYDDLLFNKKGTNRDLMSGNISITIIKVVYIITINISTDFFNRSRYLFFALSESRNYVFALTNWYYIWLWDWDNA